MPLPSLVMILENYVSDLHYFTPTKEIPVHALLSVMLEDPNEDWSWMSTLILTKGDY